LIVFGIVEHLLWPMRASDRMHARLADVFRSLAALARVASRSRDDVDDVGARRDLIAQQVTDVQGFIESSKFEAGAAAGDAEAVERLTADAQAVFLVLLAIARDAESAPMRPDAVRSATIRVDESAATILEGLADRIQRSGSTPALDGDGSLAAFERSIAAQADAVGQDAAHAGMLWLYGELAVAVNRVVSGGTASLRPAAA
jgi:Fusaric acid resistance protein family